MDLALEERKLEKNMRMRLGKRTAIIKRIEKLLDMVKAGNSQRQIIFLRDKLIIVYEELVSVCHEIKQLSLYLGRPEDDSNNLDTIRNYVNECVTIIAEHLDSRQEELSRLGGCVTGSKMLNQTDGYNRLMWQGLFIKVPTMMIKREWQREK